MSTIVTKIRKLAEQLQSKRPTDVGYGTGEYTVPLEDVNKFLMSPSERRPKLLPKELLNLLNKQENKLVERLRVLARDVGNSTKPKDFREKAAVEMKSIARQIVSVREKKSKVESLLN